MPLIEVSSPSPIAVTLLIDFPLMSSAMDAEEYWRGFVPEIQRMKGQFLYLARSYQLRCGERHDQTHLGVTRTLGRRMEQLSGKLPKGPKTTRESNSHWEIVCVVGPVPSHTRVLRRILRKTSRSLPMRMRNMMAFGQSINQPVYAGWSPTSPPVCDVEMSTTT
jgi:hypothetical protein